MIGQKIYNKAFRKKKLIAVNLLLIEQVATADTPALFTTYSEKSSDETRQGASLVNGRKIFPQYIGW